MDKEHRKRLQELYLQLQDNITDSTGVIDGLFTRRVLTRAMKHRIEDKPGSQQLRELLDVLPKRGEQAFGDFYEVLVERGENTAADLLCPELAAQRRANAFGMGKPSLSPPLMDDDELPTKWPDQNLQNPFSVSVTTVSDYNAVMKAKFEQGIAGNGSIYAMHKPTRGIFLLIGNEHFKNARENGVDLDDREGTGKDTMALTALFNELHFSVVTKVNLYAQKMVAAVKQQAGEVSPSHNCFVCAVLTHGDHGMIYGTDGKKVALDDLMAAITDNCSLLLGKPKIFLIQACQGKKKDSGGGEAGGHGDATSDPSVNKELQEMVERLAGVNIRDDHKVDAASEKVSTKSDIFVAMATVADYVSWRNTNWGTWFVQAIVYIFSRYAHKYEINHLMLRVNKLVSRAETSKGYKQVSCYKTSMVDEFYFFPGLHRGMPESHSEVDFNEDKDLRKDPPTAVATPTMTQSGSITAQPSDGVGGERSALV
ncbi:hypothetical protein ACOMHN_064134 [Nucella lapillus]